jgi:hypothetical protein
MKILINLDKFLTQEELVVKLNNKEVQFVSSDKNIVVDTLENFGLHQLNIISKTNKRFAINYVEIDGCNLRKLIYLAWSDTKQKKKLQPCNELWETDQIWTLPFGYPVSNWINLVERKFPAGSFGKNLYENYWIWYPQSIILEQKFPAVVRDFFKYNFDFTVVEKEKYDISQLPYFYPNKIIEKKLIVEALSEALKEIKLIKNYSKFPDQTKENKKEFGLEENIEWKLMQLVKENGPDMHRDLFPALWKLIDSLFLKNIFYASVGILPPGGIIYPHIDNRWNRNETYSIFKGCLQLYIPLEWPEGNYIKLANAGIPNVESNFVVINNDSFVHSLVNTSHKERIVLVIRVAKENLPEIGVRC